MAGYVATMDGRQRVALGLAALLAATGGGVAAARLGANEPAAERVLQPQPSRTSSPVTTRTSDTTSTSSTVPPSPLASAMQALWTRVPSGCLSVTDDTGAVYEINPDVAARPASVVKVLTAIAALDALGRDHRMTTITRATPPVDGVVAGDLWLVGGGDPVLGTEAWASTTGRAIHTSLDALADRVAEAGVRTIEGRVLGDDSRYDRARSVASWPRRLVVDGESGPLSALLVNDGFRVWGHPGVRFADPAAGAAGLLTDLLRARGIEVREDASSGSVPELPTIASIESPPLGDIVHAMLRDSDNETAELLFKEMGRLGGEGATTAAGEAYVRSRLAGLGLPVEGSRLADGSGLSDANRVTCGLLTAALSAQGASIFDGLAVAGRSGTLRTRLRGTELVGRLRAKTGSLDGVSALTGFVDLDDGRRLTFALLVNGLPVPDSGAGRSIQDEFALALARS